MTKQTQIEIIATGDFLEQLDLACEKAGMDRERFLQHWIKAGINKTLAKDGLIKKVPYIVTCVQCPAFLRASGEALEMCAHALKSFGEAGFVTPPDWCPLPDHIEA